MDPADEIFKIFQSSYIWYSKPTFLPKLVLILIDLLENIDQG